MTAYAELQVTTNFSFLEGASHPEELVRTAAALGHAGIAVTDRNTLAGAVRMHVAAKEAGLRLAVGARLDLHGGRSLLVYAADRPGYARLARLLTTGRRRAAKGGCRLGADDLLPDTGGLIAVALDAEPEWLGALRETFPGRLYVALRHLRRGDDAGRIARRAARAANLALPVVATGDVLYHSPARRPLQDVLTCIRTGCTIGTAGYRLEANAERHLKAADETARLFADHPRALDATVEILDRAGFSLDMLSYEYPEEILVPGETAQETLSRLVRERAAGKYPGGVPAKVAEALDEELAVIGELGYAPYFLTVHEIVDFARSRGILCQGRGSAANSAVCYCLGITALDPGRIDLLFARFISTERGEPPDIDVDFEHERRGEVIQHIYERYGRDRAGLTATVVRYRTRGAVRDVGKAMGLGRDAVSALAAAVRDRDGGDVDGVRLREAGPAPDGPHLRLILRLVRTLIGFPRHLSQHTGGFVIARHRLDELVPIENAAMAGRTVIQWDKDDIDALGILKVDILGLGMLTCIRRAFDLIVRHGGPALTLEGVPPEDPATYRMLCRADAVGVFQVESRAQMSMLPRLKPKTFYDLVIEVAIVRPGPIQGDMVHPYLRRREGREPVGFPKPELLPILVRTLGVPIFQEQAMRIAVVAAGFTFAEANGLRRAMATFRNNGDVAAFREKFVGGMVRNGYDADYAARCFSQVEGFGDYGFPESHAASFALLVYVSAWLKRRYPAAFAAALLNSQPMGFHAPAQIVRDAREHGVAVLPVDALRSEWDCTLEDGALRLGLNRVRGLAREDAACLVERRGGGVRDLGELQRRTGLGARVLERLAGADAFGSLGLDRRGALWRTARLESEPLPLFAGGEVRHEPETPLPAMVLGEHVAEDYRSHGLSLKRHPLALLRTRLAAGGVLPNARLADMADAAPVAVAGLVLSRQRPGSAKGIIFVTLEDETGIANLIVRERVFEAWRRPVLAARLLRAGGRLQREGRVTHIVAERFEDLTADLDRLGHGSVPVPARDFH